MAEPSDPISLTPIGVVRNGEHDPRRQDWTRVRSRIELQPDLAPTLDGLEGFSHVIVVGWLDRIPADLRERRQAHPGGDERLPLLGALALRGGARPNPIAVTVCRLRAVRGASVSRCRASILSTARRCSTSSPTSPSTTPSPGRRSRTGRRAERVRTLRVLALGAEGDRP